MSTYIYIIKLCVYYVGIDTYMYIYIYVYYICTRIYYIWGYDRQDFIGMPKAGHSTQ